MNAKRGKGKGKRASRGTSMVLNKLDVNFSDFEIDSPIDESSEMTDGVNGGDQIESVENNTSTTITTNDDPDSTSILSIEEKKMNDEEGNEIKPQSILEVDEKPENGVEKGGDNEVPLLSDVKLEKLEDGLSAIIERSGEESTTPRTIDDAILGLQENAQRDGEASVVINPEANDGDSKHKQNSPTMGNSESKYKNLQNLSNKSKQGGEEKTTFETYVEKLEELLIPVSRLEQYGIDAELINDELEVNFFGVASGQYQILQAIYNISQGESGGEKKDSKVTLELLDALKKHNAEIESVGAIVNGFAMKSVENSQKMTDDNKAVWADYVEELKKSKNQVAKDNENLMELLKNEQENNRKLEATLSDMQVSLDKTQVENARLNQWVQVLVSQSNAMCGGRYGRSRYRESQAQPPLLSELSENSLSPSEEGDTSSGPPIISAEVMKKIYNSGTYNRQNAMMNREHALSAIKNKIKY